jgi:alpha,alpha-trehalase
VSEATTTTTKESRSAADASKPIGGYGLIADCHSAALVDRGGSIDWLCMPRYDSDAIFARILDPDAGHWSIRPAGSFEVERRYLEGTLIIETTFMTADGVVRLTDAMAFPHGQRGHELGLDVPHELLRLVEGVSGSVEMETELAPRPEYGLVKPLFRRTDEGGRTFGGPNQMVVTAGVPVELEEATMLARFTLTKGERAGFALRWAHVESTAPSACAPDEVEDRIRDTAEGWRSWENEHDIYEGPHREAIRISSRVLKGLTYRLYEEGPTVK